MTNYFPCVFNLYKPPGDSSQHILSKFKRRLPKGFGKIGHFGTLDPFAEGVLMVGIMGAARMNDYIHSELPKSYEAVGILGIQTDTGDITGPVIQEDDSKYLLEQISQMEAEFFNEQVCSKFKGEYWQSPHKYSAAKFQGKKLHEWAREGIEIKKEKKQRFIYAIDIIDIKFPHIRFSVTCSSGTYVRSLFEDMANEIGTIGTLKSLKRTAVGQINDASAMPLNKWQDKDWVWENDAMAPEVVLPFPIYEIPDEHAFKYRNGVAIPSGSSAQGRYWTKIENRIWGLGQVESGELKALFNFPLVD